MKQSVIATQNDGHVAIVLAHQTKPAGMLLREQWQGCELGRRKNYD